MIIAAIRLSSRLLETKPLRRGCEMANTSKLTREKRKAAKRVARKAFKKVVGKLTPKLRKEFDKKPKGGIKGFFLGTNQEID